VTRTKSEAAAAAGIGAGLALRKRAELLDLLRPCLARPESWLQAGKYTAAVMSELPERNGWSIGGKAGEATAGVKLKGRLPQRAAPRPLAAALAAPAAR
jgi:hypothetical protein